MGFLYGSAGKESACNVGDLDSIPELGKYLEKGKVTRSSILAWRILQTVHGVTKSRTWLSNFLTKDNILRQHKRNNLKRYGKNQVKDI